MWRDDTTRILDASSCAAECCNDKVMAALVSNASQAREISLSLIEPLVPGIFSASGWLAPAVRVPVKMAVSAPEALHWLPPRRSR